MLSLGVLGLALAGSPQCSSDPTSCPYAVGDGLFWYNSSQLVISQYDRYDAFTEEQQQRACSLDSWVAADQCHDRCNFRLEITQPEDLRMVVCLFDNEYTPYSPEAHVDLHHPLNGVEYAIRNISARGTSCSLGGGADVSGAIAFQDGVCNDASVARAARAGGAVMSIRASPDIYNQIKLTLPSRGSGEGLEDFPSAVMPQHHSLLLWEALERGAAVRGRVVFSCDGLPQVSGASAADLGDGCPFPRMAGMCNDMPLPEDRLCSRCPLELRVAGVAVCLWGNTLLPRKAETLLQNTVELPLATAADEVVLASDLPGGGCSANDYAQLDGKIVLVQVSGSCLPFAQARLAQAQGVRAVIIAPRLEHYFITLVEGPSIGVTIPVHTINYASYLALQAAAKEMPVVAGVGLVLGPGVLAVGRAVPSLVPENATHTGESALSGGALSTWEWNAVVTVCMALLACEALLLALLLVHRHRHAVQLPEDTHTSGVSVPLGLASMGLSLSLLVIVAVVAFTLTSAAGQESMDTAIRDGRAAALSMHENAVENVDDLAARMRIMIVDRALEGVHNMFAQFESVAHGHNVIARDFDGSWQSFLDMYIKYQEIGRSERDVLQVNILTTNGFFAGKNFRNDDRTEAERSDGVSGDVATNNTGFPYGMRLSYGFKFVMYLPVSELNFSNLLGSSRFSPLSLFNRSARPDTRVWHVGRRVVDQAPIVTDYKMSMVLPFFNKDGVYWGTLESSNLLSVLGSIVSNKVHGSEMQNMTSLIVDYTDGAILANSAGEIGRKEGIVPFVGSSVRSLYTVHTIPSLHVKALGNYLGQQDRWLGHNGAFDQKDEWSHQHLYLAKLRAAGGVVVDEGGEDVKAESRGGGCGTCTVMDTDLGREVFAFDGTNVLHIYNNLTVGAPAMASTRTSPVGQAWASNESEYAESIVMSDGTECVARRPLRGGALGCFLRPPFTHSDHYTISIRVRPDDVAVNREVRGAHLFSHTFEGEANVRVFADGEVSAKVLQSGCRVKGVPGGLPVGRWTTVTVVTQEGDPSVCSVYLNGTLHASSYFRRGTHLDTAVTNPYYAGRHFHGRMDNLMMFGQTLTAAEVMSLHTTEGLVREVPSRLWFVAAKAIPMDTLAHRGATWSVAVMVPREDIMRRVDENDQATMCNFAVQEDNTNKKLGRKTNETVLVVVVIALFSVCVFLVFNSMLTRPFARYAVLMTEAAVMKVDEMPEGESFIRELRAMNSAMRVMLSNLKEYKTFMPDAIFETTAAVPLTACSVDAPGLLSGCAAVLFTDIQGSTALWEACPDGMSVALRLHNAVMREQIAAHGGYEVKTIGDAFMVGFTDLDTALAFALRTQEELVRAAWPESLLEIVQCQRDMDTGYCGLRVRMGVTSGEVNVELNEVMQRYDYFGKTVNRAARLEAQGVGGGVVVEDKVVADLAVVRTKQAVVVPLGVRELKGIKNRVALSLLVPQSLRQRVPHINAVLVGTAKAVNPLTRADLSEASLGASGSTVSKISLRGSQSAFRDRFEERLHEVTSSTTGFVLQGCSKAGDATAVANSQLSRVLASLARSDGRLLSVCGTAALVAWNVVSPCAGHVEGALRFVGMMAGPALRCGLCSGRVLSGYIGTREQRFVTAVGPCVQACLSGCFWAEGPTAVAFATQDGAVASALTERGLAAHAGQMDAAGETFGMYLVDCAAVTASVEERRGMFSCAPRQGQATMPMIVQSYRSDTNTATQARSPGR